MTATLTSTDVDGDRCPKCGLRINDTSLVCIPHVQLEALMAAVNTIAFYAKFPDAKKAKEALAALRVAGIKID